jgi:hypothetical protein
MANNHAEAEMLFTLISDTDGSLMILDQERALSDTQKKTILIKKLGASFNKIVDDINGGASLIPLFYDQIMGLCTKFGMTCQSQLLLRIRPMAVHPLL